MLPSYGSTPSPFAVKKEVSFIRGAYVYRTGCLLVQLFGSFLLLIALVKSLLGNDSSINLDIKLILIGLCFIIAGYLFSRNSRLCELFTIKSKYFRSKRSIFLLSLFLFFLSIIFFVRVIAADVENYKGYFFGEGGLVEWSQVVFLLFSIRLGILIKKDLKVKNLPLKINLVYTILTGFLLLVTLEELAWGQVIFSWKTPVAFVELNAQGETTLHNFIVFQDILDISFLLITLLISIFVILGPYIFSILDRKWKLKDNFSFSIFLPPRYSWPLSISALIISFFVVNPLSYDLIINRDQEWAEMFLYIGVFISLLRTYVLLGDYNDVAKL